MSINFFRQRLSEISGQPVSEQDAADGFQNLSGFMSVLIRVNEREKIVSFPGQESGADHE